MPDSLLMLEWLPGLYAVCRLDPSAQPVEGIEWLARALRRPMDGSPGLLLSLTRTEREMSVVVEESLLPADWDSAMRSEGGFAAMRIAGTLDFSLVGVLARITAALAAVGLSVLVISTFDTDIILVRDADRVRAARALGKIARFREAP